MHVRPLGVTIFAVIEIVASVLSFLSFSLLLLMAKPYSLTLADNLQLAFFVVLLALCCVNFYTGFALWKLHFHGIVLIVVFSRLNLIILGVHLLIDFANSITYSSLISLVFSSSALYYFSRPEVKELFKPVSKKKNSISKKKVRKNAVARI